MAFDFFNHRLADKPNFLSLLQKEPPRIFRRLTTVVTRPRERLDFTRRGMLNFKDIDVLVYYGNEKYTTALIFIMLCSWVSLHGQAGHVGNTAVGCCDVGHSGMQRGNVQQIGRGHTTGNKRGSNLQMCAAV